MKKRILSIIIAIVVLLSFAGCSSNEGNSSEQVTSETLSTDTSTPTSSSDSVSDGSLSSVDDAIQSNQNIDLNELKGTVVKVLMWRELTDQEKTTINNFANCNSNLQ